MPPKGGEPHEASTTPSAPVRKPAPKAKASVIEVEVSSEDEDAEAEGKNAEDKKDALPEVGPVPSLDFGEEESATEAVVLEGEVNSGEAPEVGDRSRGAFQLLASAALPEAEVNSGVAPEAAVLEEEAAEESDEDMDDEWDMGKFGQDYEDARNALLESETDSQ